MATINQQVDTTIHELITEWEWQSAEIIWFILCFSPILVVVAAADLVSVLFNTVDSVVGFVYVDSTGI